MRDIAQESDMHVGNLYYYFRNKQELLAFCQGRTLAGLIELAERTRDHKGPVDERLLQLITGHVVLLNEEIPGSLAHLEIEALESPWKQQILEQRDRYEAILTELLEEGIRSGVLRATDTGIAGRAILGAVNWTVKWFQPRGARTSHEIGIEIATLLVRGLLAPGREMRTPIHPPSGTRATTGREGRP
jgi:AcrR family transcriptional regulator